MLLTHSKTGLWQRAVKYTAYLNAPGVIDIGIKFNEILIKAKSFF